MPLFSSSNGRTPDTISARKAANLKRRGAKQDWFSKKAVDRRKASEAQRKKSRWS